MTRSTSNLITREQILGYAFDEHFLGPPLRVSICQFRGMCVRYSFCASVGWRMGSWPILFF